MYLYLVINTVTEKRYIGITTKSVAARWRDHVAQARHGLETAFARAIRKYGKEAFVVTILGQADSWEALCAMERVAIAQYQTFGPLGYNMTSGGEGQLAEANGLYGKGMSAEHKAKLLEVNSGHHRGKGVPVSAARRQKLAEASDAWRGQHHTEEAREKIAAARRGKPRDEATKAQVSAGLKDYYATHANPMQGRKHSAEARAKMAAKAQGRPSPTLGKKLGPLSEAHRQKLSALHKGQKAWNKGIPHREDTKAKMSASRTGGKNWKARAIMLGGVEYPSMMDAVRATGLSLMQVSYRLKTGRAQYVDKQKD